MRFFKWAAILVVGMFGLLVVIGMLVPEEYAQRARDERRQQEAEQERATTSGGAAGPPAAKAAPSPSGPSKSGELTAPQRNAVRSANTYLKLKGFSRQGLIDQLSSEFGDKFNVGDATVAVDSLSVDWNTQAERAAASYLQLKGFSCQGLIDQRRVGGNRVSIDHAARG
jgi:hypothetical protein